MIVDQVAVAVTVPVAVVAAVGAFETALTMCAFANEFAQHPAAIATATVRYAQTCWAANTYAEKLH